MPERLTSGHVILALDGKSPEELSPLDAVVQKHEPVSRIPISDTRVFTFIRRARNSGLIKKESFITRLRRYIGAL